MRHLAELVLVGLFSITAALPSCSGPTGSSDPDAGPPIDPLQTCIDAWSHYDRLCAWDYNGPKLCADHLKNAGPECRDLFGLRWACVLSKLSGLQTAPGTLVCPGGYEGGSFGCFDERWAEENCVREHGCVLPATCRDGSIPPNGCDCQKACQGVAYRVDCNPNGMTWSCDCYEDPGDGGFVSVGTCDGEPFCDYNVDLSCCNQFFMLPY